MYRAKTMTVALVLLGAAIAPGRFAGATSYPYYRPGSLDPDFGRNGIAGADGKLLPAAITDLALQKDGRVVVIGSFGIARVGLDGRRDQRFAPSETPGLHQGWRAVAIDGSNKVVVAGGSPHVAVSRRLEDGRLDTSFGNFGEAITDLGQRSGADALAIQPDGKIVVAGTRGDDIVVLRYLTNGTLDSSFGTKGSTVTNVGEREQVTDIALQPDGRIVVSGKASESGQFWPDSRTVLLRYLPSGSPDSNFGTDGRVQADSASEDVPAGAVALDEQDRILLGLGDTNGGISLSRYLTDGKLDTSFGAGGTASLLVTCGSAGVTGIAVQSDGRIVATGQSGSHMTVVRFDSNGAVDHTFANAGRLLPLAEVSNQYDPSSSGFDLALQPDGKAVVAGSIYRVDDYSPHKGVLVRVLTGGVGTPETRPHPMANGYWVAGAGRGVTGYGGADTCGYDSNVELEPELAAVGMTATPTGIGYWLAGADGGVFAFGDAPFLGAVRSPLNAPMIGLATTPTGSGYWLAAADGGVFTFGDASFLGSLATVPLHAPIVAIGATPTGQGYWLVAADGGVFAFGDALFLGSLAAIPLRASIVGMGVTPTGQGYWLVAADGGVFTFGEAPFFGSTAEIPLAAPVIGMTPNRSGTGYWLVAGDGGVFSFGAARFYGSQLGLCCRYHYDAAANGSSPVPDMFHAVAIASN